ncbi:MAG: hypothetical protein EOO10_13795 [Chitinophagaceae bacterium]|nr:MAG: hypothetical protein EOO10_13795 [Chitinophagaceae bacterium]
MQTGNENTRPTQNNSTEPSSQSTERQEQSDPQLTELRGFTNSSDDLEPTLTDGTKAPEKAEEENKANGYKE